MAPSNPLANWERLGDSFYRKVSLYDAIFDEDVDLDNYIVAARHMEELLVRCKCYFNLSQ